MSAIRLGVIGWPIAHSRSPDIHNAALSAVRLRDWRYQLLPVPPALFGEVVAALPGAGFRGVNVTIPHKEAALTCAAQTSETASAIGAANTLTFLQDGGIIADNTDAPAIAAVLPPTIAGGSALVLGAGGSARAAVWSLWKAGAAEVRVWNRTAARAEALCEALGGSAARQADPADVLINCTAAGLGNGEDAFSQLPLGADELTRYGCVVDLVYAPGGAPIARAADQRGVAVVDGLEILVRQGALSFAGFTGVQAPLEVMRSAARAR